MHPLEGLNGVGTFWLLPDNKKGPSHLGVGRFFYWGYSARLDIFKKL
jgi:hypothetical protein